MTISTTNRLSALLCALTLIAPVATPFGDNDGGLDLPGAHGAGAEGGTGSGTNTSSANNASSTGNSDGGGSASESLSVAETQLLAVTSDVVVELRESVGSLLIVDSQLAHAVDTGSAQGASGLALGGPAAAASELGADVALQGSLVLPAELVGSSLLMAPVHAAASAALIVVDSAGGASLDELLAGHVALDSWHLTGVPGSLDVGHFAQLAGTLGPGFQVSFVVASLDASGGMHLAAVRVATGGGQVEFASF